MSVKVTLEMKLKTLVEIYKYMKLILIVRLWEKEIFAAQGDNVTLYVMRLYNEVKYLERCV